MAPAAAMVPPVPPHLHLPGGIVNFHHGMVNHPTQPDDLSLVMDWSDDGSDSEFVPPSDSESDFEDLYH